MAAGRVIGLVCENNYLSTRLVTLFFCLLIHFHIAFWQLKTGKLLVIQIDIKGGRRLDPRLGLFFNLFFLNEITLDLSFDKFVFIDMCLGLSKTAYKLLKIGKSSLQVLINVDLLFYMFLFWFKILI